MNIKHIKQNGIDMVLVSGKEKIIKDAQSALDLAMTAKYECGSYRIAIDKNDNIFVANYSANTIVKITPEGNSSIFSKVQKPYCLFYDNQSNKLYVTEQETNKLIKFDL